MDVTSAFDNAIEAVGRSGHESRRTKIEPTPHRRCGSGPQCRHASSIPKCIVRCGYLLRQRRLPNAPSCNLQRDKQNCKAWCHMCDVVRHPLSLLSYRSSLSIRFSNRCFPSKVISGWLDATESERVWLVGSYFHFAGGFDPPQSLDLSPCPGETDPLHVVQAKRSASEYS